MMKDMVPLGVTQFGIGFFFPLSFTSFNEGKHLPFSFLKDVLGTVNGLGSDEVLQDIPVSCLLTGQEHPKLIAALYASGFVSQEKIAVPMEKMPQLILLLGGQRYCGLEVLPLQGYSELRVECDGSVGFDYRMAIERSNGFTNVKNGTSVHEIWQMAEPLWLDYSQQYYEKLKEAFDTVQKQSQKQEANGQRAGLI